MKELSAIFISSNRSSSPAKEHRLATRVAVSLDRERLIEKAEWPSAIDVVSFESLSQVHQALGAFKVILT